MKKTSLMPLSVTLAALAAAGGALVGIITLHKKREKRRAAKAHAFEEQQKTCIDDFDELDEEASENEDKNENDPKGVIKETVPEEEKEDDRL